MSEKRKFAAFDIDGTISRNALFAQVVSALVDRDILPKKYRSEIDDVYEKYRTRDSKDAYKDFVSLNVELLLRHMRELEISTYKQVVDEVIPKNARYTYTYTANLIKQLKSEGFFLIALSGSEMYSVQAFCRSLGFDISYGTVYGEQNGFFSDEVEQIIHRKDTFLKRFIAEHDLTIEGSVAVGDSSGDISMLEFVERPIAFNPEDTLYEHARQKGWEIVVERKNVVYTMRNIDGTYLLD
ncbi:MAG TPA: HAD-IB family phosphatase [Candidatus Saccharibacteria bacterium]|jgi:HAD superfamily phosphoserine phosphatase-like hydrolase|nr:HAD-IB family phosphatase [Candidatus Saccharibacteria bacterium]HMT55559.1 HAD-IB family phosphatase [Candidatus Saccharibacteria bacterium]